MADCDKSNLAEDNTVWRRCGCHSSRLSDVKEGIMETGILVISGSRIPTVEAF